MVRPRKESDKEFVDDEKIEDGEVKTPKEDSGELLAILKGISSGMDGLAASIGKIDKRVRDIETGGKDKFKEDVRSEDVVAAKGNRSALDPKTVSIVDELLGEDFGVEVLPRGDAPGFLFTLIVPQRLSDNTIDQRPVKGENGDYKKDAQGNVVFEDYVPEDRRSRTISSTDSYDAIRQHCERVRSYIVAYFSKVSKPLPEFRVK